ncbi:hypothetical protein KY386_00135 [Candidatus Parcubacteria bacterium]|nr:hypothetical protein [Candidatus Parcubacteria bacterium]
MSSKAAPKLLKIFAPVLLAVIAAVTFNVQPAQATHTPYNAGAIVDDGRFTNTATMSEADIQNFLASKGPCLKDYYSPEPLGGNSYGGNVRASRTIWKTAQLHGINPQVIIVTLQKEQGLVTTTSCDSYKYRTAMGMGCPDGADCNAAYFGFSQQVWEGTKLLRNCFFQDKGWYCSYIPGTTGYVKYNPDSGCGGTNVYISNRSTATLYTYTPYQPNAGALSTMGTAPCGAYGNRNFVHYMDLWFPAVPYAWQLVSQQAYTNGAMTTPADLTNLLPGQTATLVVVAKNAGSSTWSNAGSNPVRLGTSNPRDRNSAFATGWIAPTRTATFTQKLDAAGGWIAASTVATGETTRFVFSITMPSEPGTWKEYFTPIVEGITWMNDPGMYFFIKSPDYRYKLAGQTSDVDLATLKPGQTANVTFAAKNMGAVTWRAGGPTPTRLGTDNPRDRASAFTSAGWLSESRPAGLASDVPPGGIGTFSFKLTAPYTSGSYSEYFNVVTDGVTWLPSQGVYYAIGVTSGTAAASSLDKAAASGLPGETSNAVTLRFTNTGSTYWRRDGANPTRIGTTASGGDRPSDFADSSWLSSSRAAALNEESVAPGASGSFTFRLKLPSSPGIYSETFTPLIEGVAWLGVSTTVSITAHGTYQWQIISQSAGADLTRLSPGQTATLKVQAKNVGTSVWSNAGEYPVRLGTSTPRDRHSLFMDGWLAPARAATFAGAPGSTVANGQIAEFTFPITVPAAAGVHREYFSLVADKYTWMNDPGMNFYMQVYDGYSWAPAGQEAYSDPTYTTRQDLTNLTPGQVTYWRVKAKNTGSATWFKTGRYPFRLGTTNPRDRNSAFCNTGSWLGCSRPVGLTESEVAPGGIGTFTFATKAPAASGTYLEYFTPVVDGLRWLNDPGMNFYTVVR